MSDPRNIELICNGELQIENITPDMHEEIWEFYKNHFLKNENVSIACEFLKSEETIKELETIVKIVLQDNLGYIIRHCVTKELVAMCINKIFTSTMDPLLGLELQSPNLLSGAELVFRLKGSFDLFQTWNLDCLLEIVFLSTRQDFGGRGLAKILTQRSIDFAHQMKENNLAKNIILPDQIKDFKPQAVCSIFTSFFSQKIGDSLGMETLVKVPFTEFFYERKSFAEKIEPIHEYATYAAMKL